VELKAQQKNRNDPEFQCTRRRKNGTLRKKKAVKLRGGKIPHPKKERIYEKGKTKDPENGIRGKREDSSES